jgi:hypothetical protein
VTGTTIANVAAIWDLNSFVPNEMVGTIEHTWLAVQLSGTASVKGEFLDEIATKASGEPRTFGVLPHSLADLVTAGR